MAAVFDERSGRWIGSTGPEPESDEALLAALPKPVREAILTILESEPEPSAKLAPLALPRHRA